jgi:hypothetical protein
MDCEFAKRRAFYQVGRTSRALHKKEAQPGWVALESTKGGGWKTAGCQHSTDLDAAPQYGFRHSILTIM